MFTHHVVLGVDFFLAGDSNLIVAKSVEGEKAASAGSGTSSRSDDHPTKQLSSRVRAAPLFRQSDLSRALKAAQTAGLPVSGFEVAPDGRIVVRTLEDGGGGRETNDWD